jgi:DNA gyrase subunit A
MIINRSGITIRMDLTEMRVLGRATQGVRLIELRKNDSIAAVAKVDSSLAEEGGEDGEGGEDADGTDVANEGEDQ